MKHPHPSAHANRPVDSTIGIIFGVLTLILSVPSIAIVWAMVRLKRQENRFTQRKSTLAQAVDEDLEMQRTVTGHEGNSRLGNDDSNVRDTVDVTL